MFQVTRHRSWAVRRATVSPISSVEELRKHHACLERQREYYSDVAITQAEEALARIMAQLEQLCQRDDACQMMGELLRKFDLVTKLSAWTDPGQLH